MRGFVEDNGDAALEKSSLLGKYEDNLVQIIVIYLTILIGAVAIPEWKKWGVSLRGHVKK